LTHEPEQQSLSCVQAPLYEHDAQRPLRMPVVQHPDSPMAGMPSGMQHLRFVLQMVPSSSAAQQSESLSQPQSPT
jgi:hypothetical protein